MHSHAASGRKQKEGNHWPWDPDRPVNSKKSIPFKRILTPGYPRSYRWSAQLLGEVDTFSFY